MEREVAERVEQIDDLLDEVRDLVNISGTSVTLPDLVLPEASLGTPPKALYESDPPYGSYRYDEAGRWASATHRLIKSKRYWR